MPIKNCIYFLLIFSTFSSCKNKAVTFNNNLIGVQKQVLTQVQDFGKKVEQVNMDSLQTSNLKADAEKIALYIDTKIIEAQNLYTPKGGENLKNAVLKQLEFEKEIVNKIGRLMRSDISKEEKAQIEIALLSSTEKATVHESNVHLAQEFFAKQHDFNLQKK
jgi:hypothetical protein